MRARLHRFLLLLMMLALPLQGFAAASMLSCAASHPLAAEPVAMVDDTMAHCHEPEQQPDAPPAQHDCKHCAACALASTLPIPAGDMPAIMPATHRFTSHPAAAFSGFVPDGPERPPRPALA